MLMEIKRNTTIWLKDSKNKVNTTQIAKPAEPVNGKMNGLRPLLTAPSVFAVGVIKRTTANNAAALLYYPERRKLSWIVQKHTRSILNTRLTPFAESSYAMRLSTHGGKGIGNGKGKYLLNTS